MEVSNALYTTLARDDVSALFKGVKVEYHCEDVVSAV